MNRKHLLISLLALTTTACASAQAKGKPEERPALMVPPPPPRLIEAAPEQTPEPVPDLPATPTAPPARPPRQANRDNGNRSAAADPKPVDPKPVEQPPVVADPPPPGPAAKLSTPQTADTNVARVRTTIDTARNVLSSVNFGPLSNERKKAYNDAKKFLDQAEEALKEGNLTFAQAVAAKAETLAKELAGR